MTDAGLREAPALPVLLDWLAAVPPAFRASETRAVAVLGDLLETLLGEASAVSWHRSFAKAHAAHAGWALAAAHLWWQPQLRASRPPGAGLERFFVRELAVLAAVVDPSALETDVERREELVRLALRAAGMRLAGESPAEAEDRLRQVDSVERQRVLKAAAEREARAREVREAMARKAAEEAAAKVTRE